MSKYIRFAIFVFFLYFFTIAHPVYPFDTDDWGSMISTRWAHPIPFDWNPTRVLPDLLIPICSELSFVISRITGFSIVDTMTITTALLLATLIMLYYDAVEVFLVRKCQTKLADAHVISLIFLIMHFMAFSLRYEQNTHFFYSHDLCCYYYYTIPNLLCAIFVLHYLTERFSFGERSYKTAAYITYLYFLLLSNFYSSIIVTAFFGVLLLRNLIDSLLKDEFKIKSFFGNNIVFVLSIFVWLALHLIELTGGRAAYAEMKPLLDGIVLSMKSLKWELYTLTPIFIGTVLLLTASFVFLLFKRKARIGQVFLFGAVSFVAIIYSILLSSRVDTRDMMRSDVLFAAFFFFMLAFIVILDSIFKNVKFVRCFSLIILIVFMTHCNLPSRSYMDVNNVNPQWGMELSRKNIEYIKNLEYQETKQIVLPKFNEGNNFPLAISYGDRLVNLLYKQGEIKRIYHVEDVIDSLYAPRYSASEYEMTYY